MEAGNLTVCYGFGIRYYLIPLNAARRRYSKIKRR